MMKATPARLATIPSTRQLRISNSMQTLPSNAYMWGKFPHKHERSLSMN